MLIAINVNAYYDWEPVPDDEVALLRADAEKLQAELLGLRLKPALNGGLLRKVIVEEPSQTTVSLPEAEIVDCMAHFARIGSPKSRAQLVAWYLTEKVMPHHAHASHFSNIGVADEPEVEKFLNVFFETEANAR